MSVARFGLLLLPSAQAAWEWSAQQGWTWSRTNNRVHFNAPPPAPSTPGCASDSFALVSVCCGENAGEDS